MCCCGCVWRVSPGGYARHESGRAINLFCCFIFFCAHGCRVPGGEVCKQAFITTAFGFGSGFFAVVQILNYYLRFLGTLGIEESVLFVLCCYKQDTLHRVINSHYQALYRGISASLSIPEFMHGRGFYVYSTGVLLCMSHVLHI